MHLLFTFDGYYPLGGWEDFAFAGTLDECVTKGESECRGEYVQIVSIEKQQIVRQGRWTTDYPVIGGKMTRRTTFNGWKVNR